MKRNLLLIFMIIYFVLTSFAGDFDTKTFKKIDALIGQKKFTDAKLLLSRSKPDDGTSPVNLLINYYFSKITYYEKDYFSASYFISTALNDESLKMFPLEIQTDVRLLAGKTFYRIGLYGKAADLFYLCINSDLENKNELYLYLCDILLKKKSGIDGIRNFYFKVVRKKLDGEDRALYDALSNDILWEKIDTSSVGFNDPNVSDILVDKDQLYIGLWNGGFCRYDYVKRNFNFFFGRIISDNIRTIYQNRNFLYVGTMAGVTRIDTQTSEYYDIPELANIAITSIQEDGTNIYFGTLSSGIFVYDKGAGKFKNVGKDIIPNIAGLFLLNNVLYITSYKGGLYYYRSGGIMNVKNRHIPGSPITDMIRIKNKLWFTTFGNGLYSFDLVTGRVANFPVAGAGNDENFCLCMNVYRDRIYCGTLGKGIFTFDPKNSSWEKLFIPEKYKVSDIKKIIFKNNTMFIGLLSEGIIKKNLIQEN
jgi:hypothetical protein